MVQLHSQLTLLIHCKLTCDHLDTLQSSSHNLVYSPREAITCVPLMSTLGSAKVMQ